MLYKGLIYTVRFISSTTVGIVPRVAASNLASASQAYLKSSKMALHKNLILSNYLSLYNRIHGVCLTILVIGDVLCKQCVL